MTKTAARMIMLAILATAWLVWPPVSVYKDQKIEWVVDSTPALKGHPQNLPGHIVCAAVNDVLDRIKYVPATTAEYQHLAKGDPCPEKRH